MNPSWRNADGVVDPLARPAGVELGWTVRDASFLGLPGETGGAHEVVVRLKEGGDVRHTLCNSCTIGGS